MEFPFTLDYETTKSPESTGKRDPRCRHSITVHGGVTTLVGPNASGKTQILRSLKTALAELVGQDKVRFLSAGRLWLLESFRSDYDGQRGTNLRYGEARLGSKSERNRRHKIETALGDFQTLSARPDILIKVSERLRAYFDRDINVEWDAGQLKVNFARLDREHGSYSVAREASGLLQLTALLAALYDDEISVLLLDEPEVSLHPQLQSFLFSEIRRISGDPEQPCRKLVFLATHSVEMVDLSSPEDIASVLFCYDLNETPRQIPIDAGELQDKRIRALLSRLGYEHRSAFFCARPILVEGPSDAILCSGLDRHLDLSVAAANAQLLPVVGKGQIPAVIKLLKLVGKTPLALVDCDAIADGMDLVNAYSSDPRAKQQAISKGHESLMGVAKRVYSDFCKLVEEHWDDISPDASKHYYWVKGDQSADEPKCKRRASMATLMGFTDQQVGALPNVQLWASMRERLSFLLECLEMAGCFVLRRGTVEAYYRFSDPLQSVHKPEAAAHEVSELCDKEAQWVREQYADIIRALECASRAMIVDEASAVRKMVLACATPVLAGLPAGMREAEADRIAQSMLGDKASLFSITPIGEPSKSQSVCIELNSRIMDVSGFPLELSLEGNPVKEVLDKLTPKDTGT